MTNITILGNASSWAIKEKHYIPSEYKLPVPIHAFRSVRREIERQVDTQMPITPANNEMRWKIPASNVITLDFRRASFHVTMTVTVNAPHTQPRISNYAWNMFRRFRLEQHGQYIVDNDNFGLKETFFFEFLALADQFNTTAKAFYGYGSPADRIAAAVDNTYALPMPTDCLTKTIMPWFQMIQLAGKYASANMPDVTMIWNFQEPNNFIEATTGGAGAVVTSYTVNHAHMVYEELTVESGNTASFLKVWHTDTVSINPRIYWREWETVIVTLPVSTTSNLIIQPKYKSIDRIICFFRDSTKVSDPFTTDKFETYIGPNNALGYNLPITQYQWNINNNKWPDSPIMINETPAYLDPYKKYLTLFSLYHSRTIHADVTTIDPALFYSSRFFVALDLIQHPFSPPMIGPISTETSTQNIGLEIKFSANPSANLEVVFMIQYWRNWKFGAETNIVEW